MVAARILGYGAEYAFDYLGESHTVDLSQIENNLKILLACNKSYQTKRIVNLK